MTNEKKFHNDLVIDNQCQCKTDYTNKILYANKIPKQKPERESCCTGDKPGNFPHENINNILYQKITYTGIVDTPLGKFPIVPAKLDLRDILGAVKMRINIGRNKYMVKPGLYGIGEPGKESPVFVSANYKLSFDYLRKELKGMSVWILVIDTKGINVWCAAGKGTFGTQEIVKKIWETGLNNIVNHKKIIVPQLGAPGVAAHEVQKETGFKVIYGPVRSCDIKEFIKEGMKSSNKMRRVYFNIFDRIVLVPVEISLSLKYLIISILIFVLLSGLTSLARTQTISSEKLIKPVLYLVLSFISGTVITPIFLPFIPGRAFSFKGLITGIVLFSTLYLFNKDFNQLNSIELFSGFFIINTISSFFAMNFTGASTFTSLSGVKKEMKIAVPIQIAGASIGVILFIISLFI